MLIGSLRILFRLTGINLFICFLAFGTVHAQPTATADSTVKTVLKGVPVKPFGQVVFYFYTAYGPVTTAARAEFMEQKMKGLVQDPFFSPDSLKVITEEGHLGIVYRGDLFSVITPGDSIAEGRTRIEIANERLEKVVKAIVDYKETHARGFILKSIIYSGVILIVFILLFMLVNRLYRYLKLKISNWTGTNRRIFYFRDYELLDKKRQALFLQIIARLARILTILLLFVVALGLMFYLLPWTKFHTLRFLDYFLDPIRSFFRALLGYLPDFITICVIVFITVWIIRFFRFIKKEIENEALKLPGFYPEWALPTFNIIRVAVWLFAIIVIWPYIPGSDSKIFQGISVFLGLVFSLTSASLLSNLMAGFSLTYTRAFHIGDRIRVGDAVGDVIEKSMLVTKIRTIKNEEITIPNSKIMNTEVINYSTEAASTGLILHTSVTIGYDAPWRQVHQLLIDAALSTNGLLNDPPPFVLQTSLDDFYIAYQVNAYTRLPNQMAPIYSELHQNIQDKFNNAGVEIMSPHYSSLRDGNTIAIPENYRPEGYEPPTFKVKQ